MSPTTTAQSVPIKSRAQQSLLIWSDLERQTSSRLDEAKAADVLHQLGMTAFQCGDCEQAVVWIQRAIGLNSSAASYRWNLGKVLQKQGYARAAAACYVQALNIKPDLAQVHADLASVFLEAGRLEEAVKWFQRALAIDSALPGVHFQLGDAFRLQSRLEDALEAYEQAVVIEPDNADAYHYAGRVLREMGDLEGALLRFRKASTIDPVHPRSGFSEALVQLLQGECEVGWHNYEKRWGSADHGTPLRAYTQPKWRGERVQSGRILLWPEQGVGDEIMFAGLLPDVLRNGHHCLLACNPRLHPLFTRSFPTVEVVADALYDNDGIPLTPDDIKAQLPVGSLPALFRSDRAAFQTVSSPYLVPDSIMRDEFRARYRDGRCLVGIAWRSKNVRTGAARSIGLSTLAPLLAQIDVQWVSLQYGEASELMSEASQSGVSILVDASIDQLTDMDRFAAQVAAMDLVVTIDNTTAHVAGALGVPTWLMLPSGPDWRWLSIGTISPWYPTMRLFRQTVRNNWDSVVEDVRAALADALDFPTSSSFFSRDAST